MAGSQGKFVWHELMTSDPKAATTFYASVLDWGSRDSGMPHMAYNLMSAGKIDVAGIMEIPEQARAMGARPSWTGYVAVDDVDKSAAALKKAGGTIYKEPDDIPGVGRFAIVADPHRAAFALFKGAGEMPEQPPADTPGLFSWNELYAGDREADFAFYSALFGWTKA
ncbi:MAG TPA: VOC family protein, partial [Beijerinckiaceae bacterium]|nr:VOC family protein [Beijerinckiaceae bacterium]